MADLSPAEILLDSLVPAQRLIKRLQAVLKAPNPYVGVDQLNQILVRGIA